MLPDEDAAVVDLASGLIVDMGPLGGVSESDDSDSTDLPS